MRKPLVQYIKGASWLDCSSSERLAIVMGLGVRRWALGPSTTERQSVERVDNQERGVESKGQVERRTGSALQSETWGQCLYQQSTE